MRSIRFHPSISRLRRASPGGEEYEPYLRLPPLSDRVRALAVDVSHGADSPYDKATAVEQWLSRHIAVTDAGAEVPQDVDVVDALLFDQRAGSPARIATAMAVMLRSIGVPARIASGYLPGERSLFDGTYVVRARDAHVWVEVPLAAPAWQRFDPTGRIARAERADSFLARFRRFGAQIWPLLVAAAIALAAAAGWLIRGVVMRRRRYQARPWSTQAFARLARAGSKRGRPRRPHETPAEYSSALATSVLPDERLVEVGVLVTAAAYSGHEPSADARQWAEEVLKEVEASPKRPAVTP